MTVDTKDDDSDGTGNLPSRDDISALRKEIDDLNKEKHGLLKNVKQERSRRQEISGRLSQLTDTVNGILEAKNKPTGPAPEQDPKKGKLPVTWTEDGEGFIQADKIDEMLTPYQERIAELEQMVQNSTARNSAEIEVEKIRQAIVGEDERYEPAYRKYQAARKWVVDQVTDFQRANDVGRPITSGEALDYVFADKDLEAEFNSAYPNMDLTDIVTAEDSQRHLRRTLSNLATAMSPSEDQSNARKPDSRFQKVLNKPSALGNNANAKSGHESVLDKIHSLKAEDYMDLTDSQIDALLRAVAEEEKNEGVTF
jgi:hypothetical protein